MHAPAEFQLTVSRFGAWRGGLAVLGAAVWGSAIAWWLSSERPLGSVASVALLLACLLASVALASLWRMPRFVLRWDACQWHLTSPAGSQAGSVQVAIDAGAWLLMRFDADDRTPRRWLPVQRRGLEPDWQRLRSTLFTARTALSPDAAGQEVSA